MLHAMFGQPPRREVPRSRVHRLALLPFLFLAACAPTTVGSTYELSGRITNLLESGGTPSPVGGAVVRFTSDTGDVVETTSAADGRYAMQVLTDARFGQVRAEAGGYTPSERTVFFDIAQRRIDLALRPAGMMD
jgi:hypothetical protein